MPLISIFKDFEHVRNPTNVELSDFFEMIRNGKWEDQVNIVRLCKTAEEKKAAKSLMKTVTMSGKFGYRNEVGLEAHSGYISMDLDHVKDLQSVREKLEKDPFVVALWFSTSGDGLRVLFKINGKKHREAWLGISRYLFDTYGVPSDPNGVSVSKPYLVSYDPNIYIAKKEIEWTVYIKEVEVKRISNFVHTPSDFLEVMQQIKSRRISICEGYYEWLKIGFALADKFGETGREYFRDVSMQTSTWNKTDCDSQYDYCLKRVHKGSKANISTFYYYAKLAGVSIVSEKTKTVTRITLSGKKSGLKKEQVIDNLAKYSNITDAKDIVDQVWDSAEANFDDDEIDVISETEIFISQNYQLRYNEVTGYFEEDEKVKTESDLNTIFIAAKKVVNKLDFQLMMRLLKSDFVPKFNPFEEYFNTKFEPVYPAEYPNYNNHNFDTPLMNKFVSTLITDNPAYTSFFVKKWLVGCISAMHWEHCPLFLYILGEEQGTGKTEWFRRMPPKKLKRYFAETKFEKEKDDELLMTENLWIYDDELSGNKNDVKKMKNLSSKEWFSLRRPYGSANEKIRRLGVICGTGNDLSVLHDVQNRRIIPIEVKSIDIHLYNSINKDELWREIYNTYKAGFDWTIRGKDIEYLNTTEERFAVILQEAELILKYYDNRPQKGSEEWLSTSEISVEIEVLTNKKCSVAMLGRQLTKYKFISKSVRVNSVLSVKKWGVARINRPGMTPSTDFKENQKEQTGGFTPMDIEGF